MEGYAEEKPEGIVSTQNTTYYPRAQQVIRLARPTHGHEIIETLKRLPFPGTRYIAQQVPGKKTPHFMVGRTGKRPIEQFIVRVGENFTDFAINPDTLYTEIAISDHCWPGSTQTPYRPALYEVAVREVCELLYSLLPK